MSKKEPGIKLRQCHVLHSVLTGIFSAMVNAFLWRLFFLTLLLYSFTHVFLPKCQTLQMKPYFWNYKT